MRRQNSRRRYSRTPSLSNIQENTIETTGIISGGHPTNAPIDPTLQDTQEQGPIHASTVVQDDARAVLGNVYRSGHNIRQHGTIQNITYVQITDEQLDRLIEQRLRAREAVQAAAAAQAAVTNDGQGVEHVSSPTPPPGSSSKSISSKVENLEASYHTLSVAETNIHRPTGNSTVAGPGQNPRVSISAAQRQEAFKYHPQTEADPDTDGTSQSTSNSPSGRPERGNPSNRYEVYMEVDFEELDDADYDDEESSEDDQDSSASHNRDFGAASPALAPPDIFQSGAMETASVKAVAGSEYGHGFMDDSSESDFEHISDPRTVHQHWKHRLGPWELLGSSRIDSADIVTSYTPLKKQTERHLSHLATTEWSKLNTRDHFFRRSFAGHLKIHVRNHKSSLPAYRFTIIEERIFRSPKEVCKILLPPMPNVYTWRPFPYEKGRYELVLMFSTDRVPCFDTIFAPNVKTRKRTRHVRVRIRFTKERDAYMAHANAITSTILPMRLYKDSAFPCLVAYFANSRGLMVAELWPWPRTITFDYDRTESTLTIDGMLPLRILAWDTYAQSGKDHDFVQAPLRTTREIYTMRCVAHPEKLPSCLQALYYNSSSAPGWRHDFIIEDCEVTIVRDGDGSQVKSYHSVQFWKWRDAGSSDRKRILLRFKSGFDSQDEHCTVPGQPSWLAFTANLGSSQRDLSTRTEVFSSLEDVSGGTMISTIDLGCASKEPRASADKTWERDDSVAITYTVPDPDERELWTEPPDFHGTRQLWDDQVQLARGEPRTGRLQFLVALRTTQIRAS